MAARELLAAAERCDVDALRAALQAGEAPAQRREADGWTALHVAVHYGQDAMVRALLEAGAASIVDALSTDAGFGLSPLLLATKLRRCSTLELLLDAAPQAVNSANLAGETALIMACSRNADPVAMVAALLRRGADVNRALATNGRTALMLACDGGHEDATRMLLRHGAQVESRCASGRTALFFAASSGVAGCVAALLEAGADCQVRDESGETPLAPACRLESSATTRALLAAGCDPWMAGEDGASALDIAVECSNGRPSSQVDVLLRAEPQLAFGLRVADLCGAELAVQLERARVRARRETVLLGTLAGSGRESALRTSLSSLPLFDYRVLVVALCFAEILPDAPVTLERRKPWPPRAPRRWSDEGDDD